MELPFSPARFQRTPFQSLKGFGGLWNKSLSGVQVSGTIVSIPERVWWFVEPARVAEIAIGSEVSIPERVWWFVERHVFESGKRLFKVSIPERVWWFVEPLTETNSSEITDQFQSLKGFGGLWNHASMMGIFISRP